MKLCVVVDENWGIGQDGDQPYHIPEDQRFFRAKTLGKAIVLGRVTLAAFPGGSPLKGRTNIVLTRGLQDLIDVPGIVVCNSLDELAAHLKQYDPNDVFVAGGQQVYEMLLDYCDYAYITKIFAAPQVDRFFPNLDALDNWELVATSETKSHGDVQFCFCEYRNLQPKSLF